MFRYLIFTLGLMAAGSAFGAQPENYPVSQIPDSLKADAYSVVRYESTHYEYIDQLNGIQKSVRVVTVLDEKGDDEADFLEGTGKFKEMKRFSGEVYDQNGKLVKKLKSSDLVTTTFSQELASDEVKNFYQYNQPTYPYTIKYEYEIRFQNGVIAFPVFAPMHTFNQSVQHAEYTLETPQGLSYSTLCRNFRGGDDKKINDAKHDVRTWTVNGLKSIDKEPYMIAMDSLFPLLLAKPDKFVYDKYAGSQASWNDVGRWEWELLTNRDILPAPFVAQLQKMTSGLTSDAEKVKTLYEYLQKSTRYISIQLGIGGYQPIAATAVNQTSFGDCKGLSNYLRAMLKAVGINSYFTVIYLGDKKYFFRDFPTTIQSNHAVLTVPLKTDTLVLECTSQHLPFGYIHDQIAGHDALLVTPEGGKLYRLPEYPDSLSYVHKNLRINIDKDGLMKATVACKYEMHEYPSMLGFVKTMDGDEREKDIKGDFRLPSMKISNISFAEKRDANPCMSVAYNIQSETYTTKSGTRLFCPVNPLKNSPALFSKKKRKYPFAFDSDNIEYDTIRISVPEGMQIESCPGNVHIDKQFGCFYSTVTRQGNDVDIVQKIQLKKGIYPATINDELKDFLMAIKNACTAQIVLKSPQ